MLHVQPRRLADGGIDYNHYRRRAHKLRSGARRRAVRRCWRLTHRLIGAALVAAASAGFRQRPQRPEIGEACRD
jgi:hypothetical protein